MLICGFIGYLFLQHIRTNYILKLKTFFPTYINPFTFLLKTMKTLILKKIFALFLYRVENPKAEDEEYNKAKKEIETVKAERDEVRKRLVAAKAEFDPTVTEDVFGDDKCFFDLYGKNLTFDKGDFEYTVFFFKKATQRGVIEKEAISTGKWGGWDTDPVTGEPVMKYTKGRRCGENGARRNTTVVFECAKDHTFDDVDISDPCNLVFKVSSPCGCTKTVFKRLRHKLDLVSTLYRSRGAPAGTSGGSSHHSCNDDYCTI